MPEIRPWLGREADVEVAVLLLVHADVVAVAGGGGRRVAADQLAAEVLLLEHLAELLHAPVGDQELQPGPRAQPAVAVVAEDRGDALPDVGHVLERDPDAELLGEHRVGREAAADPHVEAGTVLGVHGADERDVVGLRGHVVARVAGERGLVLAREVGVLRVADRPPLDLGQRLGAVDDLVLGDAGDRGAEERPRRVAAGLGAVQPGVVELLPDRRHVLDPDPVELDVLPVGHVGGVPRELLRRSRPSARTVAAGSSRPSERTRSMKNSSSSSSSSSIAVLPPSKPGARWV